MGNIINFYQDNELSFYTENFFLICMCMCVHMNLGKLWEIVRDRKVWGAVVYGVAKSWTQLND